MKCRRLAPFILLLIGVAAAQSAGTFTTINYPGAEVTVIEGVNNQGEMVGWFTAATTHETHGFVYSGGVFTQLDLPGTTNGAVAYGINDVGQVVGGSKINQAFQYDIASKNYTVYQYPNPKAFNVAATGINNAGLIVGRAFIPDGSGYVIQGFQLLGGAFTTVSISGQSGTQLTAVNNLGESLAVTTDSQGVVTGSYLLRPGQAPRKLSVPGHSSAYAVAINDNQVLAVNVASKAAFNAAFEWQRPSLLPIAIPGNNYVYANGLNNANQVVGSYNYPLTGQGYLWKPE